jgi:hypothetical protein
MTFSAYTQCMYVYMTYASGLNAQFGCSKAQFACSKAQFACSKAQFACKQAVSARVLRLPAPWIAFKRKHMYLCAYLCTYIFMRVYNVAQRHTLPANVQLQRGCCASLHPVISQGCLVMPPWACIHVCLSALCVTVHIHRL